MSQKSIAPGQSVAVKTARRPSMADVAAVAGVSHQTVSRVLNNKGSVREETRQRILEVMADMGYRRNESARALASSQSRLIGVVTPRFVEWGPATTLLSLQLAANEAGYFVSVATLAEFTAANMERAVDDLLSLGVAGLIVIAPVEPMAREIETQKIPVPTLVIASSWVSHDSEIARIGIDQRVGVKAALSHLKSLGCDSVAHIKGPDGDFDAMERDAAWAEGVAELGMTKGARIQGAWDADTGYAAARQLLAAPLPDAVFVANDQMSLGALKALSEAGVRVPEDLRLFGFDDQDGSAYFEPALTTVRQDFQEIGDEAIAVLRRLIEGESPAIAMIPATLVLRASA